MSLKSFYRWDTESSKQWGMAWHGSREDDSPAGREADENALAAFEALSDDEKSQIDPTTRANYEQGIAEREMLEK